MPAPLLGKLIDQVGLEDAAELVALATTEQLAGIFDQDLWQSARAGQDERFDAERFVLWLEVMLEGGDRFVAERLAELPEDLVTLAFQRHLLVIGFDDLRAELEADDDEAGGAQKAFESCLYEEIEDYQLIWRGGDGWDTVLAALLALDRDHHSLCVELLERCAALSREHIDDNGGLYSVLSSEEMLEADLAGERETRRAEAGFVAPSSAAAFLRLARRPDQDQPAFSEQDPLTRAYFRQLDAPRKRPANVTVSPATDATPHSPAPELTRLLHEVEGAQPWPRLLEAGSERPLLAGSLALLAELDPVAAALRAEELSYLANVLLVGCSVDGRRLRPVEAVEHVMRAVGLGLALSSDAETASAAELLRSRGCDGLFRLACQRVSDRAFKPSRQIAARDVTALRNLLSAMNC